MTILERNNEILPKQGEAVCTGGGAVGRFVGITPSGSIWMYYPDRMERRGMSFEAMVERFNKFTKVFKAPKLRKVKLSPDQAYLIEDNLARWAESAEEGEIPEYRMGKTFIEGPTSFMDDLAGALEEDCWMNSETADSGFTDNPARQDFTQKSVAAAGLMLGAKLRGRKLSRSQAWKRVAVEGRKRGYHW